MSANLSAFMRNLRLLPSMERRTHSWLRWSFPLPSAAISCCWTSDFPEHRVLMPSPGYWKNAGAEYRYADHLRRRGCDPESLAGQGSALFVSGSNSSLPQRLPQHFHRVQRFPARAILDLVTATRAGGGNDYLIRLLADCGE